ncbi:MAG TPA: substrate-binding domain-containing protein [Xanthobacteraceae bacterium]|jgi:molybdate transport system substrate-binding protein
MKTPTKPMHCLALALGAALMLALASPAAAEELKIFGSRVTRMVVGDVGPGYAQTTGRKLTVLTDVAAVMKRRIEQGEPFDLAVLVNFQADDLIRQGKLVADSRADVMKAGIGLAVRRGAAKPDISTVAAFKQTLLKVKSIVYLKEGASTIHLEKVLAELGIAEALKAKTTKTTGESVSEMVASGEAEIGIIVIPNILSVPGAELVGPLPPEIQSYITFTAAVSPNSPNQQAARDVIKLMQSPAGVQSIKKNGMEPG